MSSVPIHVINIAFNVPGPMAASRLAALGAKVVKVEPPHGDPLKSKFPQWYQALIRGQTVVTLDLKAEAGQKKLEQYLQSADVLLSATRPDSLEKLGLGWKTLHQRFPKLCHVAIVGYASPHENRSGHDLNFQAGHGMVEAPQMPRHLVADAAGSERAVGETFRLLFERERTGKGAQALVAINDAVEVFSTAQKHGLTRPGAALGGAELGYSLYRCRQGWIAVGALEKHFFERLCQLLQIAKPSREIFEKAFLTKSAQEWEELGIKKDIPLTEVKGISHEIKQ